MFSPSDAQPSAQAVREIHDSGGVDTVCFRAGDQTRCAPVRPEALQPGTPVAVLARSGQISGRLSTAEVLESGAP